MTKRERLVVALIGLVLLAIFTFTDLQISMMLFTKNIFGRIFEVVGELPFAFMAVLAFALLFKFRSQKSKGVSIILAIVFGLLAAVFAVMGGFMTWNYLHENIEGVPQAVAIVFAIAIFAAAMLLARLASTEKKREAVSFALITITYFVLVIVVMNVIKGIWGRMRIREMTDPLTQFTRWYVITNRGGFDNAYASFPSGHAMNAAGSILLCLLPSFMPSLAGKEKLMKTIAYCWMAVIGVSRVIMGAHFASDVMAGIMLSLLMFELLRALYSKLRKTDLIKESA